MDVQRELWYHHARMSERLGVIIMEIASPLTSRTVFAEATVREDGSLHLNSPAPTLKPGARVLLTISPQAEAGEENSRPLVGTVIRYEDPFGPAIAPDEWEALREC